MQVNWTFNKSNMNINNYYIPPNTDNGSEKGLDPAGSEQVKKVVQEKFQNSAYSLDQMPKFIIQRIIQIAGNGAALQMAQTSKKMNAIVNDSERLHSTQICFNLLNKSYLIGKHLDNYDYDSNMAQMYSLDASEEPVLIHTISTGKWLASVSSSLLQINAKEGLKIARKAMNCDEKSNYYTCTISIAIATKLANLYPEAALVAADRSVAYANGCGPSKKVEILSAMLPVYHKCQLPEKTEAVAAAIREAIALCDGPLRKAEALLMMAESYTQVDPEKGVPLAFEAAEILTKLTEGEKQKYIQSMEWEKCLTMLQAIDKNSLKRVVHYVTAVAKELKLNQQPLIQAECWFTWAKWLAPYDRKESLEIAKMGEKQRETLAAHAVYKTLVLSHAASAYTQTDPLKSMELARLAVYSEPLSQKGSRSVEVIAECARHMMQHDENMRLSLKSIITDLIDSKATHPLLKLQILMEFIPAQDAHFSKRLLSLQNKNEVEGLLAENRRLLLSIREYAKYPIFQIKVLNTIARNRAQFNLDNRSEIMYTTVGNAQNIGRKELNFNRVQEVLNLMEDGFIKAECMAAIAEILLK